MIKPFSSKQSGRMCEASGRIEDAGFAYNMLQWCYLCKGDFKLVIAYKEDVLRMMEQQFNLRGMFGHSP